MSAAVRRFARSVLRALPSPAAAVARRAAERALPAHERIAREAIRRGALQKLAELAPLLRTVAREKPRRVVEIGTARGGTLYAFCRVARPDAVVVSIDLPGGSFGGGYPESDLPRLRALGEPDQQLHFLRADSHDPTTRAELESVLAGRPVDFLMIDGDHSYEGVRRDFELYAPLVRPGGLIAFHDILPHPVGSGCEVDRLWRQLAPRYETHEFLDDEDWGFGQWGGIGVLRYLPGR